jgi:hypothetical protein
MNILVCPLQQPTFPEPVFCPQCYSMDFCKHGVYTRKGFHIRSGIVPIPVRIQRYRCLNKECSRCTFSVLPPMMLRYCRFFWPCLLSLGRAPVKEPSISRGVVRRTAIMLTVITSWIKSLYREVTDGGTGSNLGRMVNIIIRKIGRVELSNRWYRRRYPRRFDASPVQQHNLSLVNHLSSL